MLNFVFRVPLYYVFLGGGSSHGWLSVFIPQWSLNILFLSCFATILYGTFSVDILVWRRPHKFVMEIGLFACLISVNQNFACLKQQLAIFMKMEGIVHNFCHRSLFSSYFPVGEWWHYSNYMSLFELMVGNDIFKIKPCIFNERTLIDTVGKL